MDLEKNVFQIDNEGDFYRTDEVNKIQQGGEYFHHRQERFFSSEKFDNAKELNDFSSHIEKKEDKDDQHSKKTSSSNAASGAGSASGAAGAVSGAVSSIGIAAALPGIVVALAGAVAVIGTSSGLIEVPHSDHVSMFMSRSTELGFEIERNPDKRYVMYLSNEDRSYHEAIDFIDQVVFTDLIPNTVYDLVVYDTSVDPYQLVYSSNYLTAAHDEYSSYISNIGIEDDYLTFNVEYDGEAVDFVTIQVLGDNNEVIYTYEGAPIDALTVNVAGYENVTCRISVNGQITEFEHLVSPNKIVHVESVSLSETTLELGKGESKLVIATVLPENTTNKELIWSSSDESIATVESGIVTAIKEGRAIITAKSVDGYISASLEVNVNSTPSIVHVESISLDKTELDMVTGDRATLSATVLPNDAKNKSVIWSSSDESIATINSKGRVTAVGVGTVTITATTVDGELTATCTVNITQKVVSVTGISLDVDSAELEIGESEQLVASVLPGNASNKEVIWSSTNEAVVTVDENGVVTAISAGEAIITVKTVDGGYQDYCIITVK